MRIGQVATSSGVSERMIRHYEKLGLVPAPTRSAGGLRQYDDADVHRLRFVALARDLGFGIAEIRELLSLWTDRDRSDREVERLALERAEDLARRGTALELLRASLRDLARRCHEGNRPDHPLVNAPDPALESSAERPGDGAGEGRP